MSEFDEPESLVVYRRLKELFGDPTQRSNRRRFRRRSRLVDSIPFGSGRDPNNVRDVLATFTHDMGWNPSLAQSDVVLSWVNLVGNETAKHSQPEEIRERVLVVRCDSTAWATQLRLMLSDIMTRISVEFPDSGIDSIRFIGPQAPSWKRGPRAIPGRGPRDTYG